MNLAEVRLLFQKQSLSKAPSGTELMDNLFESNLHNEEDLSSVDIFATLIESDFYKKHSIRRTQLSKTKRVGDTSGTVYEGSLGVQLVAIKVKTTYCLKHACAHLHLLHM